MTDSSSNTIDEQRLDELVRQSQAGNKEAFGEIYEMLVDKIHRYVYFKVPPEEVDDIVEIGFVKIWTNIGKYKKTDVSFQAWVFRIIKNLVIDHHRFHRSIQAIDSDLKDERREADPRKMTELQLNSDVLRSALAELKENYQQIIIMKFINDMSNEEIAYILRRRNSAIRVLQFRALAALRRILEEKGLHFQ